MTVGRRDVAHFDPQPSSHYFVQDESGRQVLGPIFLARINLRWPNRVVGTLPQLDALN